MLKSLMNNNKIINLFKIIIILLLFTLIYSIYLSWNTPANGYEPSIYKSTPQILWISIIALFFLCLCIILYITYFKLFNLRIITCLILILFICSITCLSVYIFRGYYLWNINGDGGTHLGIIKYIIQNGKLPITIYPITHIYSTEIYYFTNINYLSLDKYVLLIFNIMYIIFMYTLIKNILKDKYEIILAMTLCFIFTTGWLMAPGWHLYFLPNILSNIVLPIALFIIVKFYNNKIDNWKYLYLIIIVLFPVFHPVTSLALLIIVSTLFLPYTLYLILVKKTYERRYIKLNLTYILLFIIWFIIWISNYWYQSIMDIYYVSSGVGSSHVIELTNQINSAESYGYDVLQYFLKLDGGAIFFYILSLLGLPIIYDKIKKNDQFELFSLYGPFFVLTFLLVLLYFFKTEFIPIRILDYILMLSVIFSGYTIYFIIKYIRLLNNNVIKLLSLIILFSIILSLYINGLFILYPSPSTYTTNPINTYKEYDGVKWLLDTRSIEYSISSIMVFPSRYLSLTQDNINETNFYTNNIKFNDLPPHFNYNKSEDLDNKYIYSYLIITKRDKSLYTDVFPDMAKYRFYESDFNNLSFNLNFVKIYANGEFDTFLINI